LTVSVFEHALAVLLADPNMAVDALWKAQGAGAGVACRVIRSRPDLTIDGFGTTLLRPTDIVAVAIAAIPAVAKGDTFTLAAANGGTEVLTVRSAQRDVEQLTWECAC
jgi:hypothetical protein